MTGVQTCALPICFPVTILFPLRELKGKSRVDVITKFIVLILTVFTNLILSVFVGVIFYFTLKFFLKSRKDA